MFIGAKPGFPNCDNTNILDGNHLQSTLHILLMRKVNIRFFSRNTNFQIIQKMQ